MADKAADQFARDKRDKQLELIALHVDDEVVVRENDRLGTNHFFRHGNPLWKRMNNQADRPSQDFLHGLVIAQASLLKSLISVLPKEALQSLLPELERDTEYGNSFLLPQELSDETVAAFSLHADYNLDFVREQLEQKGALDNPAAGLQWIRDQQRGGEQQ